MKTALKERANAPQGLTLNRNGLDRRAAMQSIDLTCTQCGTSFVGDPRGMYCSPRCKNVARKLLRESGQDPRRCAFKGCARPYYARGHCKAHCDQIRLGRAYGPIETRTDSRGPLQSRLDVYTEKTEGCWIWTGARNDGGYGQLNVNGKQLYAHRLSYECNVGPIPDGMQIDHLCRVTRCIRPEHLEPVTPKENIRRMRSAVAAQPRVDGKFASRGETYTEDTNHTNGSTHA